MNAPTPTPTPTLKEHYLDEVVKALMAFFSYKNIHQVPRIEKIVINSAVKATEEKNWIKEVHEQVTRLAGQSAIITKAKKSISNFKLREGMPIGVKVTLRGDRMYGFLLRFLAVVLPGVRDFRGILPHFDGCGNLTIGVEDITVFPEITLDGSKKTIGLDVTIVTSAKTNEEGYQLLKEFGMPFRRPLQSKTEPKT